MATRIDDMGNVINENLVFPSIVDGVPIISTVMPYVNINGLQSENQLFSINQESNEIDPAIAFAKGGDYNEFPCRDGVYYLKNIAIRKTGTLHTLNDPWFNIAWDQAYPGLQQECELSAEIYSCCRNPAGGGEIYVGKVVFATSKQISSWETCTLPDGRTGKKIVFQQVFLQEDLDPANILANVQTTINTGTQRIWNTDGICAAANGTIQDAIVKVYQNFLKVFTNVEFRVLTEAIIEPDGEKSERPATWYYGSPIVGGAPISVYLSPACRTEGPCEPDAARPPKDPTRICVEITSKQDALILTRATTGRNSDNTSLTFLTNYGMGSYDFVNSRITGVTVSPESLYKDSLIDRSPNGAPIFQRESTSWESVGNCEEREIEFGTEIQNFLETRRRLKFCYRKYADGSIDIQYEAVQENGVVLTNIEPGEPTRNPYNRPTGNTRRSNTPECGCPTDVVREYLDSKLKVLLCQVSKTVPPDNLKKTKDNIGYIEIDFDCNTFRPPTINPIPKGQAILEYDLETARWELTDACSCEEVLIADLYCTLDGQRYQSNPIHKKDIRDKRTWVPFVKSRKSQDPSCVDEPETGVYFPFDKKRDIVVGKTKHITKGLFNNQESMLCYLTSSTQTSENKKYYYDVSDCDDCFRSPYYALAYGHINGLGSTDVDNEVLNKTYSDTVYSQYQLICNDSGHFTETGKVFPKFSFVSQSVSLESDDIYAINFYREGISDRLDAGNFQINLSYLSGSFYANSVHTGSNVKVGSPTVMSFIDDSNIYDEAIVCDGGNLISYNIVSGSLNDGIYEDSSINTYGKVYPELGIVVFHPKRLNELLGFNTVTGSNVDGDNAFKLFTSISGAASPFRTRTDSYYMKARNITYRKTTHYFVRLYPERHNYTNNQTFVSGSKNEVLYKCFIEDPQTYITTVGLYDKYRQLLGIAKLSRPVNKNFDKDLLIKIRLNW
jgi:hypothetical protein